MLITVYIFKVITKIYDIFKYTCVNLAYSAIYDKTLKFFQRVICVMTINDSKVIA